MLLSCQVKQTLICLPFPQMEVPSHLCCEDPSWLYHIFQDTYVHIAQVLALISSALEEASRFQVGSDRSSPKSKLPGPVQDLRCVPEHSPGGRSGLVLDWLPPWNAELFQGGSLSYSILLQEVASGKVSPVISVGRAVNYSVREGLRAGTDYRAWVRCAVDGSLGPFAAVELCSVAR